MCPCDMQGSDCLHITDVETFRQVARFLGVNADTGLFFFDSSYRPVPLTQQYIGVTETNFMARNNLMNEICYNKVFALKYIGSIIDGHNVM